MVASLVLVLVLSEAVLVIDWGAKDRVRRFDSIRVRVRVREILTVRHRARLFRGKTVLRRERTSVDAAMICLSGGKILQAWHHALGMTSLAISNNRWHTMCSSLDMNRAWSYCEALDVRGRKSMIDPWLVRKSGSGRNQDESKHFR